MDRMTWLTVICGMLLLAGCAGLNRYPVDGSLVLDGLDEQVNVVRDEKGMAYIHAATMDDAMLALGYVTAQDRLFQMTLTRLFAEGRISELAGEKGLELDIRNRTLGFHRHAIAHARILASEERRLFQNYVDGINASIATGTASLPLEFKLAGISPEPWKIEDCLAIYYLMGWDMSANLKTEVIAQMLVEKFGVKKAGEIFPLNLNPDDEGPFEFQSTPTASDANLDLSADDKIMSLFRAGSLEVGSNNWVAGPTISASGKPVVCDDPHMKSSMLPGPLYPVGIITPGCRVVGAAVPGVVGLPIFRSDRIAVGVTNAYADVQDLYVETVDSSNPDHYLEGDNSLPFTVIDETIKIRDKKAPNGIRSQPVRIRLTRRGPVVSDVIKTLATDKVLTVRWSAVESITPELGFVSLFRTASVKAAAAAIGKISVVSLNFVFADTDGNIGWHVSGRLPIRSEGDGTVPHAVADDRDNWRGFVPFEEMPHAYNPEKGWLGTCNHHTVPRDYPYYYSSYQSPSYRYRRIKQLMDSPGAKGVDDHWQFQRDTLNLMAQQVVPFMTQVLTEDPDTRELADLLEQWDFHDDVESVGATVFHSIYERFAWLTFADELGEELAGKMLAVWYFWQERFQQMVLGNDLNRWFDDVNTPGTVENKRDILKRAALDAQNKLVARLGADTSRWHWGRVHKHTFVSPIRRKGIGKGLLGGGTHPAAGSVEALYRGRYEYNDSYQVSVSAVLRMVADLGDDDKVLAVIAGGVAGRMFHPHATDQIEAFMNGEKRYWWFSESKINEHAQSVLRLQPQLLQ